MYKVKLNFVEFDLRLIKIQVSTKKQCRSACTKIYLVPFWIHLEGAWAAPSTIHFRRRLGGILVALGQPTYDLFSSPFWAHPVRPCRRKYDLVSSPFWGHTGCPGPPQIRFTFVAFLVPYSALGRCKYDFFSSPLWGHLGRPGPPQVRFI